MILPRHWLQRHADGIDSLMGCHPENSADLIAILTNHFTVSGFGGVYRVCEKTMLVERGHWDQLRHHPFRWVCWHRLDVSGGY